MKIKYFPDTDVLLIDFSDHAIVDSQEINGYVLVNLDEDGFVVSMTIEHAKDRIDLNEFSYQTVAI